MYTLGASLANLGISDERAEQLADDAATIGQFLKRLQIEERNNRQTLAVRLEARESFRLWILVIAKNDMEADVAALTRGRGSTVDIDRLMVSTDAIIVQTVQEHPERIGLLGTNFEAKLVQLPALTAIDVVREYADDALNALLNQHGFRVPGPTNGRGRLLDSELAGAFRGEPVGTARRGPKAGSERLAPYDALIAVSRTNDIALNRAFGRALIDCE